MDIKTDMLDQFHAKIEAFLDSHKPTIKNEFPDGFEEAVKGKLLKRSLAKLGKLTNYQEVTLYALSKEADLVGDPAADGAGDGNNQDPDQNA